MRALVMTATGQLGLAHVAALHLAFLLSRGAEAWEPVLLGGLIPILGAAGIGFLLWYAVRQKPEEKDTDRKGDPR